ILDPEFSDMQDQRDEVFEPSRFHHIAVGSRLIAGLDVRGLVGTGENDDRDVRVASILFEALQEIDTPFSPQFEVEQNESRFVAALVVVEQLHRRETAVGDIKPALVAGLWRCLAKQVRSAWAVVDE